MLSISQNKSFAHLISVHLQCFESSFAAQIVDLCHCLEPVGRRTTLVFEHKQGMIKGDSVFADVRNKLSEICDVTKVDIRPQVSS